MPRPETFDSADLDAILELRRSPGWTLVMKRLFDQVERKRTELENPDCAANLVRGEISAFRVALAIPEILEQEIKAQL